MIARLIGWSIANRFLVLLATVMVSGWGVWAVLRAPLDAIPDLSDVQVIIRTTFAGQAPQIVEDQVTYPLTTTMASVPGAKTVRGYSFFGDSFVYVLFEDGTDPYWARSRVLEYLSQVQARLPAGAKPALGPDATGVGWIYQYALVDRSGRHDLGALRALQDWFLKYELKSVANVAEVASIGGMVRQYQIVLAPDRLRAFGIPHAAAVDRAAAARYGMSVADVQSVLGAAIGGENIGETIESLARFPINVRYPRELRDSLEKLRRLPVVTERGAQVPLGALAAITVQDGPPMIRSENARLAGWVYVDIRGRDLVSVVRDAQRVVAAEVELAPGMSVSWSGQFEYLERAKARLAVVVPATLAVILVLLYLTFRRLSDALLIMASLPLALVGGVWLLYALGHNVSIASAIGFIAPAGVSAEFGVVMLVYLKQAIDRRGVGGATLSTEALREAIHEGAVLRVRPKAMTVAVILAGLLPIMLTEGTGAEMMQRIAAPMIGGMVSAPLLSMLVIPAVYLLMHRRRDGGAT